MNPTICKNCGLPVFHGAAGYVGPQCKCQFATLPQLYDTLAVENARLRERVAVLEKSLSQYKAYVGGYEDEVKRLQGLVDSAETRLHEVSTHCATVEQELAALKSESEKVCFYRKIDGYRYKCECGGGFSVEDSRDGAPCYCGSCGGSVEVLSPFHDGKEWKPAPSFEEGRAILAARLNRSKT